MQQENRAKGKPTTDPAGGQRHEADVAHRHDQDHGARGSGPYSGTPLASDDVTLGPLERELAMTAAMAEVHGSARTAAEGEMEIDERQRLHIEDNTRHDSSIGRR